jgi:(R,R)-butanediol dehydrogenase/meso-butanediol dehydrogenase/diacetyl reductase
MKALQFSVSVPQWVALKALGLLNKKFFYKGPLATVKLSEIPEPPLPSEEWVKIKTLLCGFCASDLNLLLLRDSPSASPFTSFPCTMGHEICGEIVETGADAGEFETGDVVTIAPNLSCEARGIDPVCRACRTGRVGNCENFAEGNLPPGMFNGICQDVGGGFGEYFVAHQSQIFKIPEGMSYEEGALIEPFCVGLQAVTDNMPQRGDQVFIIGGGVIGTMIVKTIRALDIDCRITVSEPSAFQADLVKKAGADEVIADGDLFSHTVKITGAKRYKPLIGPDILMGGFNRIFDVVGNSKTLNQALRALAVEGVLSVVGIGHEVKLDLTPMWLKRQTMRGVFAYGYTSAYGEEKHIFQVAIDLVKERKAEIKDMATHTFRIEEFDSMIETNLDKARNGAVKTMVSFT